MELLIPRPIHLIQLKPKTLINLNYFVIFLIVNRPQKMGKKENEISHLYLLFAITSNSLKTTQGDIKREVNNSRLKRSTGKGRRLVLTKTYSGYLLPWRPSFVVLLYNWENITKLSKGSIYFSKFILSFELFLIF